MCKHESRKLKRCKDNHMVCVLLIPSVDWCLLIWTPSCCSIIFCFGINIKCSSTFPEHWYFFEVPFTFTFTIFMFKYLRTMELRCIAIGICNAHFKETFFNILTQECHQNHVYILNWRAGSSKVVTKRFIRKLIQANYSKTFIPIPQLNYAVKTRF